MYRTSIFLLVFMTLASCKEQGKETETRWQTKKLAEANKAHNQLFAIEKEQGWQLLFDGETLDGWHLYNKADSTSHAAWEVRDGMLFCNATDENRVHGDLVTDQDFEDYELAFDWKIATRGNSGIFINVQEAPEYATAYQTGPEYQLLEPSHMDTDVGVKRPGCLYGFSEQLNTVEANPAGQWNHSRIVQRQGKIEFYLNGKLTATEDFSSASWKAKVDANGFSRFPAFGQATKGKIALQNWYFEVWFRNMKIREIPS